MKTKNMLTWGEEEIKLKNEMVSYLRKRMSDDTGAMGTVETVILIGVSGTLYYKRMSSKRKEVEVFLQKES